MGCPRVFQPRLGEDRPAIRISAHEWTEPDSNRNFVFLAVSVEGFEPPRPKALRSKRSVAAITPYRLGSLTRTKRASLTVPVSAIPRVLDRSRTYTT